MSFVELMILIIISRQATAFSIPRWFGFSRDRFEPVQHKMIKKGSCWSDIISLFQVHTSNGVSKVRFNYKGEDYAMIMVRMRNKLDEVFSG